MPNLPRRPAPAFPGSWPLGQEEEKTWVIFIHVSHPAGGLAQEPGTKKVLSVTHTRTQSLSFLFCRIEIMTLT